MRSRSRTVRPGARCARRRRNSTAPCSVPTSPRPWDACARTPRWRCSAGTAAPRASWLAIALEGTGEAHMEAMRALSPKKFKNRRRLDHKLEREHGEVSLIAPDRDGAAFEQILTWKREQLKRSGLHDLLRPTWVQGLMRQQFATTHGPLQGLMITLRAGGRLVAGHFGVRTSTGFHPWIASVDLEMGDRVRGLIEAGLGWSRREKARQHLEAAE